MKRSVPATPFRVIGPPGESFSTSSGSPEQMSTNMAAISDAAPAQDLRVASSTHTRTGGRSSAQTSTNRDGQTLNQYNTQNVQHNTLHHHQQQNVHHSQSVHNTIDPQQLEQLVEATVQFRVESTVSQMRDRMNAQLARMELEHQARLTQAEHESRLTLQRLHDEGSHQISKVQRERDLAMQQLSADAQQLQQAQQERASLVRQAEGEILNATQRAEAQISMLAVDNQKLMGDRQMMQEQMHQLKLELAAAQQKLMDRDLFSAPSSVAGSPPMANPFDTPAVHGSPKSEHLSVRACSVASVSPLETMYCSCCGSQNVIGRPSCWRCGTMFSAVTANNGTDIFQTPAFSPVPLPPPSVAPSKFSQIMIQEPMRAYNAAGSMVSACAGIPPGPLSMCAGGVGNACVGDAGTLGVQKHQILYDPNGPRIQSGHVVPQNFLEDDRKSNRPPSIPENITTSSAKFYRMNSSTNSQGSTDGTGSRVGDGGDGGGTDGGDPPSGGWLLPGEKDESVFKIKHLKGVQITRLPNDATSCREWRAAFLAAVSRIDLTERDVLVKFCVHCMDGGRGRKFREELQASTAFTMFSKHVAAELIKPEVLATNTDLAHELTSWVEECATKQEGPKGMPLMNLIISFYETGTDSSVALSQMHLLSLQLTGKSLKEIGDFVKKTNYVLHGLKSEDRPAENTLYAWLWHQVKRVPMLNRVTERVRNSKSNSKKRTFDWLWGQIAEELRERRHDSNFENVSKGLQSTPPSQLALPAQHHEQTDKKSSNKSKQEAKMPAVPGPLEAGKGGHDKTKKAPCALHAAGHCRFGTGCRNLHTGDPGSDAAKKAFTEYQQSNQGSKGGQKGSGKNNDKGSKGTGKGKKGKKGDTKTTKGGNGGAPAAVAAAASTVTITEVEGQQVQKAWQSFCTFCEKALPSLNVFLKLSVPILATLISSITNSYSEVGEVTAATMVHPAVQNFRKYSLEFLGDTGAAHDIGSLRALEDQGISRDMIEPWIKTLESPVRFATGGGPQLSTEALKIYNKGLGDFNMHLLSNCPMALSIGRQVAKGRTFVWEHGKKPFIALNHRRCRVFCPLENRWYADRVQHHVPIFRIDSPVKPGEIIRDQAEQEGGQTSMCAVQSLRDISTVEFQTDCISAEVESDSLKAGPEERQEVQNAAVCSQCVEGTASAFCEECMERQYACVCSLYPEVSNEIGSNVVVIAHEREHDDVDVEVDLEKPRQQVKPIQEHLKKASRKARRRERWKTAKADGQGGVDQQKKKRHGVSIEDMVRDMKNFYEQRAKGKDASEAEVYQQIAKDIQEEHDAFVPEIPGEAVVVEQHHEGLPGHGMLIEFCTSQDSMLGVVGKEYGIHVVRCTETSLNVEQGGVIKSLEQIVEKHPGCDLHGSLPCGPWSQWQNMSLARLGDEYAKRLDVQRMRSRLMIKKFFRLAKIVIKHGGRVSYEWPRHCAGWTTNEIKQMLQQLDMMIVDFDGCRVGVVDGEGRPHLKRWRIATTDGRMARIFSKLRCNHDPEFQHSVIEGSKTNRTGFYPRIMCEYIMYSLFPDIIVNHCPAMPVVEPSCQHEHREHEPEEEPVPTPTIFESVDSFACPAEMSDGDAPADDEDDRVRESRDERLKREAQSLEHMILHDRKNPFCEHCCRGRMLKRYAHRFRADPEEGEMPYEKAKEFGSIIEADNIFPSVESRGMGGELCALIVRDRYSGVSIAYPQTSRDEDSNYESLKHFAGYPLSGRTDTVFCSDTAPELTNAASRLCWVLDPSAPNYWPHNAHLERDVRALKELSRPSHIQAGFHRRLWTVTVDYVSKARSFFSPAPVAKHELGTEVEELKKNKTRWQIATGSEFEGPRYPLGALVYYRSKGDLGEPTTKPGIFAGWHVSPGLRYKGNLQIIDYEAVRTRAHLHWIPKVVHQRETFLPPVEHLEFPLARAARSALLDMTDVEMVLKRDEFNKSLTEGVLPYDVCIDAFPLDDKPPPPGHAYITSQRLDKHGKTPGCSGCEHGHSRHTNECRDRFDNIYGVRGTSLPPTPGAAPPTPAIHPPAREERASGSGHPRDPLDDDIVPECPPEDIFDEVFPAAVTRQLPRAEVIARPDALQAIRKEFDGIANMGTWDWDSVDEEYNVKRRAIDNNETIHLADLLAICSEKHVELEPAFRQLKGRVCYRGDAAKTESGNIALYQTLSASPASIVAANAVICFGLMKGHKITTADAVKAYLQSELKSLHATWVRLPREVWPQSWFWEDNTPKYKRPLVRLKRSLYGHPEAGSHWEIHLSRELKSMGGVASAEFSSVFHFPDYQNLCLVVYVDDFILSGPSEEHDRFWAELSKKVLVDDIGDLGRFLGRHHTTVKHNKEELFAFDMRAYAQDIVTDYLRVTNGKPLKKVNTPFFANGDIEEDDSRGELASQAASVLMKMMWLARLARPDLLRVTTWLATKIQKWCCGCDIALHRAICYIDSTKEHLLTGFVGDSKEDVFVEFFVDADLCGSTEDCYSTSGAWIQLSGEHTSFPLCWVSKKQTAVSRSTTESETVALANSLFEDAIPLAELFSTLLERNVLLRIREDNEACAKVCAAGYSKKLRHLKRVHRINLASVKEQLDREDTELMLVGTKYQRADIFTKALAGPLWGPALLMLGIYDNYEVLKTSNAGLKISHSSEMTLAPSQSPAAATGPPAVYKEGYKKRQKRKPLRIEPFSRPSETAEPSR